MKITIGNYELDIFRIILAIIIIIVWFIVGYFLGKISPLLPISYVALTFAILMTLLRDIKRRELI